MEEEERNMIKSTAEIDRISDLPRGVLDRILLLLPTKEAVRTIALSKAWHRLWLSVLILPLNFDFQGDRSSFEDFLDRSTRTVNRAVASRAAASIRIVSLRLHIPCDCDFQDNSRVLEFVQLVDRSGILVEELSLVAHNSSMVNDLNLTDVIFRFRSLTSLKLCNMSLRVDTLHSFSHLRDLQLVDVDFDDVGVVNDIVSRCPVLEVLVLECSREGNGQLLRLRNIPKIKKVKVAGSYRVEIYGGGDLSAISIHSIDIPLKLDSIKGCENLRELDLSCPMTNRRIQQILVKFPLLESLSVNNGLVARKIQISSRRLKKLLLCFDSFAPEIKIDAPNLKSYEQRVVAIPSSFRVSGSSQLQGTFFSVLSERVK